MRKIFSGITVAAIACVMAACGGSDDKAFLTPGGTGGLPPGSAPVASVAASTSAATIPADSSSGATITALVRDANNNAVSGATVTFAATAGNIVVTTATTDANGQATGTLTAAGAAAGTQIQVSASAGGQSSQVTVGVVNAQQSVTLLTTSPQIPSNNSAPATITAIVRNASNALLSGVTVSFAATSGAVVAVPTAAGAAATPPVTAGTTDANGEAQATFSTPGDDSNRSITITATAGTSSATITVSVVGTKLSLTGPASLIQGSQGTYTVVLADSGGTGIPNQTVNLASAKGNTLSAPTVTTNASGQATFQVTGTSGGADTLTATALGLQSTESVTVSTQNFAFTAPAANAKVNLNTNATVTVNWTNSGAPVSGQTVTFSATRGTLSAGTAMTDAQGNATLTISSNTAGPAVVSATGNGVTAQTSIDFVATNPTAIAVQASPATIQTQAQSTITATVRDVNNNLVEGQVVNFAIQQDPTGGSLSVASATTNAQGQASTVYTASSTTSAANGVVIGATVQGTAVTGTASLTVGGSTVFLSLGTGNTIIALNNTQYELPYSVQAVDAAGNGVNNVQVTFNVTSLGYLKGYMLFNKVWSPVLPYTLASDPYDFNLAGIDGCRTEDLLGNGILEPGEDYNNNGKLDPGLVANTDVSSATTANGGSASFNIIYPKDHAYWVAVKLTASATVNGTQSSTSASFWLPGLATDYDQQTVAPPGENSPYGQAMTCANPN
jgi:hypothetical protein